MKAAVHSLHLWGTSVPCQSCARQRSIFAQQSPRWRFQEEDILEEHPRDHLSCSAVTAVFSETLMSKQWEEAVVSRAFLQVLCVRVCFLKGGGCFRYYLQLGPSPVICWV